MTDDEREQEAKRRMFAGEGLRGLYPETNSKAHELNPLWQLDQRLAKAQEGA
jgi:hypothetical protein